MTDKIKAIVVDIDGTIACGAHRLPLMPQPCERGDPLAWEPFHMACGGDTMIYDVKELILAMAATGVEIIYVSYRSESTRDITTEWLSLYDILFPAQQLFLRPGDSDAPAGEFKLDIVRRLEDEGYEIIFALDDDPDVCHAFRQADIPAYQVRDWKKPMPSEAVEMPGYTPGTKAMAEKAAKPLGETKDMTSRYEKAFVVVMASTWPTEAEFSTRPLVLIMEGIGPMEEIGQGEVALDLIAAEEWLDRNIEAVCGFGGVKLEPVATLLARGVMVYPEPGGHEIDTVKDAAMIYYLKKDI